MYLDQGFWPKKLFRCNRFTILRSRYSILNGIIYLFVLLSENTTVLQIFSLDNQKSRTHYARMYSVHRSNANYVYSIWMYFVWIFLLSRAKLAIIAIYKYCIYLLLTRFKISDVIVPFRSTNLLKMDGIEAGAQKMSSLPYYFLNKRQKVRGQFYRPCKLNWSASFPSIKRS